MGLLGYVSRCTKIKDVVFGEAIYQECLEIEIEYQHNPFIPQKEIKQSYRNRELKQVVLFSFILFVSCVSWAK
jgi:hypothetical protein